MATSRLIKRAIKRGALNFENRYPKVEIDIEDADLILEMCNRYLCEYYTSRMIEAAENLGKAIEVTTRKIIEEKY